MAKYALLCIRSTPELPIAGKTALPAAVDYQIIAGGVGSFIRRQIHNAVSDFIQLAGALHRHM